MLLPFTNSFISNPTSSSGQQILMQQRKGFGLGV